MKHAHDIDMRMERTHKILNVQVFEMNHNQICSLVKGSGNQLQMVIER